MIRSLSNRIVQRKSPVRGFRDRLVTVVNPDSASSAAYHMMAIGLQARLAGTSAKIIAVTSACALEGKSTTCANLGVALAQAGERTLVVDCDLRKPVMHRIFGVHDLWGMADALQGECSPQDTLQHPLPQLSIVPAGLAPPNPVLLINDDRFSEYLRDISEGFRYVLLDIPPIGGVSDSLILANRADGVLLVVDVQSTPKERVRQCRWRLETVGTKVVGVVINHAKS